jgi:hypothetical protein
VPRHHRGCSSGYSRIHSALISRAPERLEHVGVVHLVADDPIESFHEGILIQFAWLNIPQGDPSVCAPGHKAVGEEFRAIVEARTFSVTWINYLTGTQCLLDFIIRGIRFRGFKKTPLGTPRTSGPFEDDDMTLLSKIATAHPSAFVPATLGYSSHSSLQGRGCRIGLAHMFRSMNTAAWSDACSEESIMSE